jgi:hypothetical protein
VAIRRQWDRPGAEAVLRSGEERGKGATKEVADLGGLAIMHHDQDQGQGHGQGQSLDRPRSEVRPQCVYADGDSGLPWMMLVGLSSDLRIERGVDALALSNAEADMNVMFEDLEVDCMKAAEVPVVMIDAFEVDVEGDWEGSLGSILG